MAVDVAEELFPHGYGEVEETVGLSVWGYPGYRDTAWELHPFPAVRREDEVVFTRLQADETLFGNNQVEELEDEVFLHGFKSVLEGLVSFRGLHRR